MNNTPRANRVHIGIFGRCNVGKSQLLNAITSQNAAVVSDVKGTTTDPVYKTMELAPLGPVVFIDTAGLDDESIVGERRIAKTNEVLRKIDIALIVIDGADALTPDEGKIKTLLDNKGIKYLIVQNKSDLSSQNNDIADIAVSALNGNNIDELKELITQLNPSSQNTELLDGIVSAGDIILLVTPIDTGAPKGRIILPQQQTIRGILDTHAVIVTTQPEELEFTLNQLKNPPALVITDSQVFSVVSDILPSGIPLTSFSILFARFKGILGASIDGVNAISSLKDGDNVLIVEGCSHQRQCEDIGTVKIPNWLLGNTKKQLEFSFVSGGEFPDDLSEFALIVHCGGCMLNNNEILYRLSEARLQNIPITNYGILIAHLQDILERSIEVFDNI